MAKSPLSHPGFFREGDYVTDQRRLYRVLQIVPARFKRRAAILEDCHTLDAALLRPRQLARMQLRVVEPVAPCTPAPA
jgi:hypothetical protein